MKSHYTYRLIAVNPIDERVEYIGVRSCNGLPADDVAYMSSSREIRALIRNGMVFEKQIIAIWPTRTDAINHEIALHKAYDVARAKNFFNEARQTSVSFSRPNHLKWSKENCINDASKYASKTEWKNINQSSYNAARKNGWLEECSAHIQNLKFPNGYWTYEACKAEALKYKTRSEWRKNSASSLFIASKNGWLEDCCAHMKRILQPSGYWTLDKCRKIAKSYSNKAQWQSGHLASYKAAMKSGFIDLCCSHMDLYKPRGYWTQDNCRVEAQKYKSRSEWAVKSGSSYKIAQRNGWLNYCSQHMFEKEAA